MFSGLLLSYRDSEEMMQVCGFDVDRSAILRWVGHYTPRSVVRQTVRVNCQVRSAVV